MVWGSSISVISDWWMGEHEGSNEARFRYGKNLIGPRDPMIPSMECKPLDQADTSIRIIQKKIWQDRKIILLNKKSNYGLFSLFDWFIHCLRMVKWSRKPYKLQNYIDNHGLLIVGHTKYRFCKEQSVSGNGSQRREPSKARWCVNSIP